MFNTALKNFQENWKIINNYQNFKIHMYLRKSQKNHPYTKKNTKHELKIDVKILSFWFFLMHVKHVV